MSEVGRMDVVAHWRMDKSAEGVMLVYGDSKYEQDPPRVATALESALLSELRGAVEENERLRAFAFGDAPEWEKANATLKHRVRELEAEVAELHDRLGAVGVPPGRIED